MAPQVEPSCVDFPSYLFLFLHALAEKVQTTISMGSNPFKKGSLLIVLRFFFLAPDLSVASAPECSPRPPQQRGTLSRAIATPPQRHVEREDHERAPSTRVDERVGRRDCETNCGRDGVRDRRVKEAKRRRPTRPHTKTGSAAEQNRKKKEEGWRGRGRRRSG